MSVIYPKKFQILSLSKKNLILPCDEAKEALRWCLQNHVDIRGWEGCFVYRSTAKHPHLPEHQVLPDGTKIMGFGPSSEVVGVSEFPEGSSQQSICEACIETIAKVKEEYAHKPEMKGVVLYYWLLISEAF